ncbi:hypothetical protein L7F22_025561 [Adiantum nelumboides]|nr:hypothetical protein [Adiantum nelumboides]
MEEDNDILGEPLKLNVYDLTHMNGYMYWFGLGVYHSAIEAYGIDYAYGAHDYPTTGVFEVEPRQCPGFKFRKSITLGTIEMGPDRFREFVEEIANEYSGDSYHLLFKNCNHFCDDVCMRLVGSHLPPWINRLAKLGPLSWALCRCFVPDVLQPEGIKALDYEICDLDETKNAELVLLCKTHDVRSDRFDEDVTVNIQRSSTDIPKYIPCGQCSS